MADAPSGGTGFSALRDAFQTATERREEDMVTCSLAFAGRPGDCTVVGVGLHRMLAPSVAHLRSPPVTPPSFTISLWDCALTGVRAPPPPTGGQLRWQRPGWTLSTHGAGEDEHRWLHEWRPGQTAVLDRRRRHLIVAYDDPSRLSWRERGRPVARLLAQLYRGIDVQRVHAALVGVGDRGALIVGASGSGKTTVALDCAMHGLDYLGDDVAGVRLDAAGVAVGHSIYGSANVTAFHLDRHPALTAHSRKQRDNDKTVLQLSEVMPERLRPATRVCAIIAPQPAKDGHTSMRPLKRLEALRLLVPATPEHVHAGFGTSDAARTLALLARTPCYRMMLGVDSGAVAHAVRQLLDPSAEPI